MNPEAIKDVFKGFFDVMREVVKALVTFAAILAVAVGAAGLVGTFADALAREARDRACRTRPPGTPRAGDA